jgi:hypothetical protein
MTILYEDLPMRAMSLSQPIILDVMAQVMLGEENEL